VLIIGLTFGVLYYVGQRSAFLAMFVGIIILLFRSQESKGAILKYFLICLSFGVLMYVFAEMFGGYNYTNIPSLYEKIAWPEYDQKSILDRLNVQMIALIWVINNPLGMIAENVHWSYLNLPVLIGVHNNYLGAAIKAGLIALILCLLVLFLIISEAVKIYKKNRRNKDILSVEIASVIIIGLFFVQGMLHNAGMASYEPVTLIMLGVFCSLVNQEMVPRNRIIV
jgi:hypothetical protein